MIVRLMNEGQYRMNDDALQRLNALDDRAGSALEREAEEEFRKELEQMVQLVLDEGERLEDGDLTPSDVLVPPSDLSLEEAHELFSGEGLIPDLPVREGAGGS